MSLIPVLIAIVAVALVSAAWLLWRSSQQSPGNSGVGAPEPARVMVARPEFPEAGLLVPEEVLRSSGSTSDAIWDALEAAAVPIAVEYYPATASEIARFRTVPVNAAAQQAMVDIVKALNPRSPTLFRVVLPKGAELVKAVGTSGFRGFSRTSGQTAHAVLKPVAAGGAVAAGWPVFAVAGTVMAVDTVAQRQQLAHQRRVEAVLGRQEERYYLERIRDQRTADGQLSHAMSLILDGHQPNLELALKSAYDEFNLSEQFLHTHRHVTDGLVDDDGMVDYRRLELALGGKSKDVDYFVRELHLSRAAIAIRRKALVAEAAARALADPDNPYTALRRFLDAEVQKLEQADVAMAELTEQLLNLELKGPWHKRDSSVADRQLRLRKHISPASVDDDVELRYLVTDSGEVVQLLPSDHDGQLRPVIGE